MYKLLLCLRYLRTRYIALASIISVTLGVATMIVVNAVMAGFSHEMKNRIQGFLSDITLESRSLDGFPDADLHMDFIRRVAGDDIEEMTATVQVPGMFSFQSHGQWIPRQVHIVGIDERSYSRVGDFGKYLFHPDNREQLNFQLRENGYDAGRPGSPELIQAGWEWRRLNAARLRTPLDQAPAYGPAGSVPLAGPLAPSPQPPAPESPAETPDPLLADGGVNTAFTSRWEPETGRDGSVFDPAREQHTGVVVGVALGTFRNRDVDGEVKDVFMLRPGDDVMLTFPTAGNPPKAERVLCTIVDFYESKMFEYDSSIVFVPLKKLQEMRGMFDRATGVTYASSIRIKLRDGARGEAVRDKLRAAQMDGRAVFPLGLYEINTWRDKQGPLLAAVEMETATLNLLLFLIIAVAGFGILATFFMIVVEKTKDIGILKSLGASASGVAGIFVSYGLSLGCVGGGAGIALGLLFIRYINEIRRGLEGLTGREVFDPTIYYFHEIPTIVHPVTIVWVLAGAILIAVLASVLPAIRAACLHPVEALRT